MIDFVTSISWVGWGLIAIFVLTLWQVPALLREARRGRSNAPERPTQPGEDPPHLNPGVHISTGSTQNDTTPGTGPQ